MEGRPGLLTQACRVAGQARALQARLPHTLCLALLLMRQVLKVWDASGKLLAGPVSLTDFFGQSVTGRFSDAFCERPSKSRKKPLQFDLTSHN